MLSKKRLPEGLVGMVALHELLGRNVPARWADLNPDEAAANVVVGIETDRGPWVPRRAVLAPGSGLLFI